MPQLDFYIFPTQIFCLFCLTLCSLFFFSYLFSYIYFFESELVEYSYQDYISRNSVRKIEKIMSFTAYQQLNFYYSKIIFLFFL